MKRIGLCQMSISASRSPVGNGARANSLAHLLQCVARGVRYRALAILATLLVASFVMAPASATETIRTFSANVVLLANGAVDVTETIQVRAEGRAIKRGIFRDVPTILVNDDGSVVHSKFNVIEVTRDGATEPFHTQSIKNGIRIYVGDADVHLDTGVYTYTIRYTMSRMARRFEDHDEIYWNATGNFWDFAILDAVAQVTLPDGAVISDLQAYTGGFGTTGSDATIRRQADGTAIFRATRILEPGEGMTISASFQKGVLDEPSALTRALYYLSDHRGIIVPGISVFLVILYNFFAWNAVGRDPKKSTIIPLFHPPAGFSPALAHHVYFMGWKKNGWTAFTAAMINLAVKGLIRIEKVKKKTTLTTTGARANDLPPGEQIIHAYINLKESVTIDKKSGASFGSRRSEFVNIIGSENRRVYFNNNIKYILFGVALSIACLGVMVIGGLLNPVLFFGAIGIGIFIGLMTSVFGGMWSGGGIGRFIFIVWALIIGGNFIGAFAAAVSGFDISMPLVATVSIVVVNVVFAVLMRAPTIQGRKTMDQIEGFRMYLDTAEKERLNMVGVPEMTIARFEAILPYAVALGVEKPWSEHFEAALSRHAVADAGGVYHPHWYLGTNFTSANLGADIAAIGTGMSASMISAQPSSSSSSGGGGGGFSGGGGGGGGGGGW